MRTRRLAASLLSVAMLSVGLVTLDTTTAAAATPKCTRAIQMKPRAAYSYYMLIPKSANTVKCYMNQGTQNRAVVALQQALAYCYSVPTGVYGHTFGPNDIDGIYGPATRNALEYVQIQIFPQETSAHDGIYGPRTAAAMEFPWHNPSTDRIMSTCTRRDGSSAS
ncbi:peptidoglycan-binding domain-containing protein [Streptomyces sp. NPDC000983]|uniref:peptidoglycan-binding domain-containing protein n=1 Tax=Streptomyces sp. NPDC000983 TaxID=3154373 RepID=UPI0033177357